LSFVVKRHTVNLSRVKQCVDFAYDVMFRISAHLTVCCWPFFEQILVVVCKTDPWSWSDVILWPQRLIILKLALQVTEFFSQFFI